jgi:hypothetical protein
VYIHNCTHTHTFYWLFLWRTLNNIPSKFQMWNQESVPFYTGALTFQGKGVLRKPTPSPEPVSQLQIHGSSVLFHGTIFSSVQIGSFKSCFQNSAVCVVCTHPWAAFIAPGATLDHVHSHTISTSHSGLIYWTPESRWSSAALINLVCAASFL